MTTVPVVLFVFNRPDVTRQVLTALQAQTVSPPLIVAFADGARHADEAPPG